MMELTYSHLQESKLPELTENSTAWHFFVLIHYLYYSGEAIEAYGVTYS